MNASDAKADEREEIENLLPWHAAGTLSRRDAERVERALAGDPELQRRFELVREELGEVIHLNENLGAPSARAMDKLLAAIEAEPARTPSGSFSLSGRIAEWLAHFSPRTLAYAGAAAAVVIMLQAGIIGGLMRGPQTFSTASVEGAAKADGVYAQIRFAPTANAEQISKLLRDHNASIVEGPSKATGLYRIRVAAQKDEAAGILKRMQEQTAVVGALFPEPPAK